MIIASNEAPLNPPDDAPEFEADHDDDLIAAYLNEVCELDMRSECAEMCNDADMIRAFLNMDQWQFDALARVCLPAAVYAQSIKSLMLINLRAANIDSKDRDYEANKNQQGNDE